MGIELLGLLHQAPHPRATKMHECAGTLWVVALAALSPVRSYLRISDCWRQPSWGDGSGGDGVGVRGGVREEVNTEMI